MLPQRCENHLTPTMDRLVTSQAHSLCTIAIIPKTLTLLKKVVAINFSKDEVKATVTKNYILIPN